MRVISTLLFATAFLASVLLSQAPVPQPQQAKQKAAKQPPSPGRIEGRVVDNSGQPLPNVSVALTNNLPGGVPGTGMLAGLLGQRQTESPPDEVVQTAADGSFAFDNVVPSGYHIDFSRSGFMTVTVGAVMGQAYASADDMPRALQVGNGQTVKIPTIVLSRQAVIAGSVMDGDEGLQGAEVRAARYFYVNGLRELRTVAQAVTNDLGAFRLPNLEPGRYYLYTENRPAPATPAAGAIANANFNGLMEMLRPQGKQTDPTALFPTYYPNSLNLAGAAAVDVAEGGQGRADIRLRREPIRYVRGVVTGISGNPARAMVAVLNDPLPILQPNGISAQQLPFLAAVNTNDKGEFELRLPAGSHRLIAFGGTRVELKLGNTGLSPGTGTTPDDHTMVTMPLAVSNADVKDVRVKLAAPGTLQGLLRVEGGSYADLGLQPAAVTGPAMKRLDQRRFPIPQLIPMDQPVTLQSSVNLPDAKGIFSIDYVAAGRYRLEWPRVPPAGYYIKSIRFGGVDITRSELNFSGAGELEVTLVKGTGTITATAPALTSVVLWPKTPDNSSPTGGTLSLPTDGSGIYRANSHPPGEYYIAAFTGVKDVGLLRYRPFLERFNAKATSVKLDPTGSATVNLTMLAAEEIQAEIAKLQ